MLREGSAMEALASQPSPAEGLHSPHMASPLQPQGTAKKPSWKRSWHIVPLLVKHRLTLSSCLPKGETKIRKLIRLNPKCLPVDIADIFCNMGSPFLQIMEPREWWDQGTEEVWVKGRKGWWRSRTGQNVLFAPPLPQYPQLEAPVILHSWLPPQGTFNTSSELLMAYKVID